jgi:uncharacterized glyoxalase superfamily protein PhnB
VKPVPFVYTTDMRRSLDWYRRVIPSATLRADGPHWSELDIEGHTLAFHAAESLSQAGAAGITFVASESLEGLLERLAEHGIEPARGIQVEPFGRSLVLGDPDGFTFQVNEYRG